MMSVSSDVGVSGVVVMRNRDDTGHTDVEGPFHVRIPHPRDDEDGAQGEPRLVEHRIEYFTFASPRQQDVKIASRGVLEQLGFLASDLQDEFAPDWSMAQAATIRADRDGSEGQLLQASEHVGRSELNDRGSDCGV